MRLSINTKLFFLIFVAFSILIGVVFWRIDIEADSAATENIERSLRQSSVILETKLSTRKNSIEEIANGIARDGRILPLVFDGESTTLQDLGLEFKEIMEFDILFFTDAEGTIIARPDRPEAIGRNVAGRSALFDTALTGKASDGVITSRGKLLQMVVVPIFDNIATDVVRGTVALAYEFSEEMAREINALTTSDVGFFVVKRNTEGIPESIESTYNTDIELQEELSHYFSTRNAEAVADLVDKTNDISAPIDLNGDEFYYVVHRLSNDGETTLGFIMALHSKAELLAPFTAIQNTVLIVGLVCLVIALFFALIFAQRIGRPISSIVALTRKIEEGAFRKQEKNAKPRDEIDDLHNAVIHMGNALSEKAELESYLAGMGNELDLNDSISVLAFDDSFLTQVEMSVEEDLGDKTRLHPSIKRTPASTSGKNTPRIIDGRYEIIRSIGSGAIGKVYLARDMELKENVAIKMMEKSVFSEQESMDFREEIRLARKITHRNILRTYDYGDWNKYYYITMEYVQGFDLNLLLNNKGAFDTNVAILIARQICSALAAAHEEGIIHRDLKPANMLINRQGILKIMDFGLAIRIEHSDFAGPNASQAFIAGTPRFMAPEQFSGRETLDERTDIYAMGAIFYTLFNGAPPFSSGSFEELYQLHASSPIPKIQGTNGPVLGSVQSIIEKAMAKAPEDRYQSVREVSDALNKIQGL